MQFPLFSHKAQKPGILLFLSSGLVGITHIITQYELPILNVPVFSLVTSELLGKKEYCSIQNTNITSTLLGVLFIVGGLLAGFSKVKQEDEYIRSMRLSALLWAVMLNYGILLLAFLLIYGLDFISIMVYNMFTTLIFFNLRFHYLLYRASSSNTYDEQA